ncbi:MAG: porin [Rhodospirillales bacterium]|nr:porin [Rhodospirillales bacterium]MDE1882617.1 porin [Rhodospirillales bacterium]MDE2459284.1 porin [Rhodospirillales bacterium]
MRKLLLASAATLLAAGAAFAQPAQPVAAPGSVVVHLNGYFQFGFGAYGATNMGSDAQGYKLNSVSTFGDFRLLPGFDAQTLNGIWYGVQFELRTTTSNAGVRANPSDTGTNGVGSLYIRRGYGYIGTPNYGFVRFGDTDSAFTLSQVGVIENFGDGAQFNADGGPYIMLPSIPGQFVYADSSHLYTTSKIVYETPAVGVLGGELSGIIGFEPSSNGLKEGQDSTGSALGSAATSIAGGSNGRRRNTLDASVSYSNVVDAFANKVSIGFLHGAPLSSTNGSYGAGAPYGYDELNVFEAGAQTTYAGLTVGANIKGGQLEDGYYFKPKGARNALGYIVGASYNMGPYTLGASYFNQQSSGAYVPGKTGTARTLNENGVAVGANYQLAKPIGFFIQYLYGQQHQPTNVSGARSNVHEQVIAVGTTLKW